MAIKIPIKNKINQNNDQINVWIKQGKNVDSTKIEQKMDRKQISVYLNKNTIKNIKIFCANNDIKLNDFYENAILEKLNNK